MRVLSGDVWGRGEGEPSLWWQDLCEESIKACSLSATLVTPNHGGDGLSVDDELLAADHAKLRQAKASDLMGAVVGGRAINLLLVVEDLAITQLPWKGEWESLTVDAADDTQSDGGIAVVGCLGVLFEDALEVVHWIHTKGIGDLLADLKQVLSEVARVVDVGAGL